jgi:hypothetical protein
VLLDNGVWHDLDHGPGVGEEGRTVISYSDLSSLQGADRAEIQGLFDRSRAIADMPADRAQIRAWDELAADCDRIGFPDLTVSARLSQYHLLSQGGEVAEAVGAFARLMQVIRRHRNLIRPRKREIVLGEISTLVMTAVEDPRLPLERVEKMIHLVDQEVRLQGVERAGIHLARAVLSGARGDGAAVVDALERYRAEDSEGWPPDNPAGLMMEIPLLAQVDLDAAQHRLQRAARVNGLDLEDPQNSSLDEKTTAQLLVLHAVCLRRQQRHVDADRIADELLHAHPVEQLRDWAPPEHLTPVLENHPRAALVVVDHTLANLLFDGSDWQVLAAVARSRRLADPEAREGRLLQALADEAAATLDARGGTAIHARELQEFWWRDLPARVPPEVDPHQWADFDARAALILTSGWVERAGQVSALEAPRALTQRYRRLLDASVELVDAATEADADALAESLLVEARLLRCAATQVNVPLFRAAHAADHGDLVGFVTGYRIAQQELLRLGWAVPDFVPRAVQGAFGSAVRLALAEPAIGWQVIEDLLTTQERIVSETGGPRSSLVLARLEVAAHLGEVATVRDLVPTVLAAIESEVDRIDPVEALLTAVRLTAEHASDVAASLAERALASGDEVQRRAASMWLSWLAGGSADSAGAVHGRRLIERVEEDPESLESVPGSLLIEVLAPDDGDLLALVEALIVGSEPLGPDDLGLMVAAAQVLRTRAPDDPRWPQWEARATEITRLLDARNGSTRWTAWLAVRHDRVARS